MFRQKVWRVLTPLAVGALVTGMAVTGLAAGSAGASQKAVSAHVPGLAAHSITIGATVPLTGAASPGYDQIAEAANAVFKYVNAHGKINGRSINYIIKDDCYDIPANGCTTTAAYPYTVTQTQALLATHGGLFATVGSLGTPTQDSVSALLNSHHVPQLFVNSGSIDWDLPVASSHKTYPDLFGFQQSYVVEGKITAKFIKATYPGQKVCFLGQNDDFGTDSLLGFTDEGLKPKVEYAGPSNGYNPDDLATTGYLAPFISSFQSAGCTVAYLGTIPAATAVSLGTAEALSYKPHWVISSVGSDPITIHGYLGANDDEAGAVSFAELPASTDSNPWSAFEHKVLEADTSYFNGALRVKPSTILDGNETYGVAWGVAFCEALKAAGKTFTQASFVHTLETTPLSIGALLPLRYTAINHSGLLGGYMDKIKNTSQSEPIPGAFHDKIYTTTSVNGSPIVLTPRATGGPPSWL